MSEFEPEEAEALVRLARLLAEGDRLEQRGIPYPGKELRAVRERMFSDGDLDRLPQLEELAGRMLEFWSREARRCIKLGSEWIRLVKLAEHLGLVLSEASNPWPFSGPLENGATRTRDEWSEAMATAARTRDELKSGLLGLCLEEGLQLGLQFRAQVRAGGPSTPRALDRLHELVQAARYQDISRIASALVELRELAREMPPRDVWARPRATGSAASPAAPEEKDMGVPADPLAPYPPGPRPARPHGRPPKRALRSPL